MHLNGDVKHVNFLFMSHFFMFLTYLFFKRYFKIIKTSKFPMINNFNRSQGCYCSNNQKMHSKPLKYLLYSRIKE